MGTIFSRVKLSGKHVAALLALMLLSAVTAMLLPTALASMIDIGVAGEKPKHHPNHCGGDGNPGHSAALCLLYLSYSQ